ncbi:hypothetical protein TanjilG_32112 [Lupinus angustifolius]|uniref:CCT domain-containing protein n=1 Tax=Lupinus angustifolius TaxID=3871 RepID=A0A1J7IK34_LUPAN|nr:hypothetical protein TanjilG_32112 [Lupinus angustifolius]
MDLLKDEIISEDLTSRKSSSSSEVFEEANEQQIPNTSKKSVLNLSHDSTFISPELYEFFESCLPNIVKGRQWVLLYSTSKDGVSLRTLIRKSAELSCPCLLIAGDMKGAVFGGLLECPLKPTPKRKYQGTNQTFVFTTIYGQPTLFRPTGANRYYYMCLRDFIAIGGGGNYALCLDEDLLTGTSGPCDTFGNKCLAHSPEFELKNVEDEISIPISNQILDLCDSELFQEPHQNSEVTSSSNCCYDENSSYVTNISLALDNIDNKINSNSNNTVTTPTSTTTNNNTTNNSNLSIIFDSQEDIDNDISASIDFSSSKTFNIPQFLQEQFGNFSSMQQPNVQQQLAACNSGVEGFSQYPNDPVAPLIGAPLTSVFEEDCISSVPSYMPLNPSSLSCNFLGPAIGQYMPIGPLTTALSADRSGLFGESMLFGSDIQTQELEYQAENGGMFCTDSMPQVFSPSDLQALGVVENQKLVVGAGNSATLTTEISSLEDSTFKVGKLSVEQRKEKIHRYMKKRNERNFSKKIKYACRKTLADSRPRVRGRFAKNDEFGDTHNNHRSASSNHEEDDEEVVVKEEDDMVDSSDIFAHISGVNSFKCNYSIQSWI